VTSPTSHEGGWQSLLVRSQKQNRWVREQYCPGRSENDRPALEPYIVVDGGRVRSIDGQSSFTMPIQMMRSGIH
jgi:hypothetical protein